MTSLGGETASTARPGARRRVLVLDGSADGQSHGPLGAVRALSLAGHEVHLAHAAPGSVAARSRHVAQRHRIPSTESPRFVAAVRDLLAPGDFAACFPTSDAALVALDWPGAALVNKAWLRDRLAAVGTPAPESRELGSGADLLAVADSLTFPLAVKPAVNGGAGSFDAFRADGVADLKGLEHYDAGIVVERWIDGVQRAVTGIVHQGRLLAVTHQRYERTWPVECGVACAAVTEEPDPEVEREVVALLDGYDGLFQCQHIEGHVHDVNPRVFGSLLLSQRAGVNLPDLAVRLAVGGPEAVAPAEEPVRAAVGVRYRWVEGDLKNLRTTLRDPEVGTRDVLRRLRPRRGTVHSDVWISDPAPSLARVRHVVGRLRGAR
ncbi:hypothetical protein G7072_19655 [Nocardioides sp. HDW12B]|uniref:hypothetical protein n=1 Tax=Nocardioides sp. HDW12B TaxID=2714939 RepID=UPI001409EC1F|nr:hypothetical protein [Nocardioides sp. HDW12B]QIK68265.1 hypothetical protein G7072_19655 [Nocardioides sp. HDW12B]